MKDNLLEPSMFRQTTSFQLKKNLFKKAIELSVLTGVDIFIVVFDRDRQKMYELNSSADFDI